MTFGTAQRAWASYWGMFDKKAQAEALILDDEGSGHVVDTDIHGVNWDHHKYIVEVRPPGGEPFRVETKSTASKADHPTCQYCAKPLPCEPVPEDH